MGGRLHHLHPILQLFPSQQDGPYCISCVSSFPIHILFRSCLQIDVLQDTLKDLEKELDSARKELTELAEGSRNVRLLHL